LAAVIVKSRPAVVLLSTEIRPVPEPPVLIASVMSLERALELDRTVGGDIHIPVRRHVLIEGAASRTGGLDQIAGEHNLAVEKDILGIDDMEVLQDSHQADAPLDGD
jgi:hypothetical protein